MTVDDQRTADPAAMLESVFAWRCQECRRLQPAAAMPTAIIIMEAVVDLDEIQPTFRRRSVVVCRDCLAHIKEREPHAG